MMNQDSTARNRTLGEDRLLNRTRISAYIVNKCLATS